MIDTPTSPVTSGLPLFFVITVTAIKQVSTAMMSFTVTIPTKTCFEVEGLCSELLCDGCRAAWFNGEAAFNH